MALCTQTTLPVLVLGFISMNDDFEPGIIPSCWAIIYNIVRVSG